jgi:hypothetical protein
MIHTIRLLCLCALLFSIAPAAAQVESAPESTAEVSADDAFLDSIPGSPVVSAEVTELFERLVAAVRDDNTDAFHACFDADGLIDRGFRILGQDCGTLERVALTQVTVTPMLDGLFDELKSRVGTTGTQPRMEKRFEDGAVYFVLRTRADEDLLDRYVHFCMRAGDLPVFVDFEYEDSAVWASEQVAYSPQAARAPEATKERLKAYALAFEAALQRHADGMAIEALQDLEGLREEALALGLQAPVVYWRTLMELAFNSGRRDIADRAARELITLRPATSLPRFYRGRMALDAGHLDAARVHLANYQRLVGPDAQALAMMGDSYEQSGDLARAVVYWGAALDQNPDLTDALYSLGMQLSGEDALQVVERFRATSEPLRHFEPLVSAWSSRGRCSAVSLLSAARRADEPRDPNAYYYEAACALQLSDFERVEDLALQGRALVPEDQRRPYDALWIEAAWSRGDPLDVYRNAPDKAFAFDAIGEQLVFGAGELEQLVALIELRRADDPQDVWIPYYQGQAYHAQGLYAEADDHLRIGYTHALESADDDRAAAYRLARVDNAYAGGSGISAYLQMDEEDVYRRLLELILSARDGETLAQLIALRSERFPDDPQIGFWLAHAQIISGQEEAGLQRLIARRGEFAKDPDLARWMESDLVRGNLRLKRYEQAMGYAETSTRRDGNPFFEFLVQVARGNAAAAERIYEDLTELGYGTGHVYGDHDIGRKLLTDEAFARFRTLWPPRPADLR